MRVRLPVMDLAPTSTLDRMSISWSNSAGYQDVHVYLDDVDQGRIGSNATSYEFTGLTLGTMYEVRLELKNPTQDAPTITVTRNIPTQSEL
ncbi:hypothetical protein ACTID9_27225 [Brevibacillus fluminis]|uniref:hypothetical protein n=1 Tax=Brevibacillus fluminis TaxID=511487 RepID=UPI003F887780